MNKSSWFKSAMFALSILMILLVTAGFGLADNGKHRGDFSPEMNRESMIEYHEQMLQAVHTGYDAWVAFMKEKHPDAKILTVINADNFNRFVEMVDLQEESRNKMEEAHQIAEELGFPAMGGSKGLRGGFKGMRHHDCLPENSDKPDDSQ